MMLFFDKTKKIAYNILVNIILMYSNILLYYFILFNYYLIL